jgi:peptidyl-prolyl cis-trans isomerase C
MKCSVFFLSLASCATLAWPQTAPPPVSIQSPAPNAVKPRGPEAVASVDPKRVVATIDGKQITAADAMELLKPFPPDQRKQYESNLPNLVQQIYMREQLADAAKKLNLEQQAPWKDQLELSRANILAQAYLNHLQDTASKAPSGDPQQFYNAHPGDFDTVKLSGIFVVYNAPGTPAGSVPGGGRTESEASEKVTDLEKKLKAGEDFVKLARAESDNQGSAAKGGDLGTHTLGSPTIPADIKAVILKLQPGQFSEPVKIQNGFLIVKLDSRTQQSFTDARAGIVKQMQDEKTQAAVKETLDKYKLEVQDPDFFNAASGAKIPTLKRPTDPNAPPAPGQPAPKQ